MGGALNANLHVHAVVPDGVFVEAGEAASETAAGARPPLRFLSLPSPTDIEVEALLRAIAERGAASLARPAAGGGRSAGDRQGRGRYPNSAYRH